MAPKRLSASSSAPPPKRPRNSTSAQKPTALKFKSPAEFFAENKNIAGFDNAGKSLYTTIRELVENSLDAAEAVDTLPDISVVVERIDRLSFRSLVGISNRGRVDTSLYKDVETDKERKVRERKEARGLKRAKKQDALQQQPAADDPSLAAHGKPAAAAAAATATALPSPQNAVASASQQSQPDTQTEKRRANGVDVFRVTVTDNGSGMAHEDVPNMMGRVLAGTKYCVRQARGKFGLGSKMALIWAKMSTGMPVQVTTANTSAHISHCVLDIDIAQNIPSVLEHEQTANTDSWRGSKVCVIIEGNWSSYKSKILLYMRQMAVITPYAQFRLKYVSGADADSKDFELVFSRRTDIMPRAAKEVRHHPSSVNQLILKQLISDVPARTTLVRFLATKFEAISASLASRLITELGRDFSAHMTVGDLSLNHIRQIDALLHEARFDDPDGSCLSPAGEYNLRLGISKELRPTLVATHAEPADVFEGHPFMVEAGVALGGKSMKPGINIFRFANRIPLLFEAGNDVVTRTARESIRWANYKISPVTDRIGVICSIVSTKIPFKGTGKEYIGDDADAIKECVRRAIRQCCAQLKTKLVRRAAQADAASRKRNIIRYAPDVVNAVVDLFEALDDAEAATKDVLELVRSKKMTRDILRSKLIQHVEQVDKEQAIEFAAATGRDEKTSETLFLAPRAGANAYDNMVLRTAPEKNGSGETKPATLHLCFLRDLQSAL